jgi:hypothetical protein
MRAGSADWVEGALVFRRTWEHWYVLGSQPLAGKQGLGSYNKVRQRYLYLSGCWSLQAEPTVCCNDPFPSKGSWFVNSTEHALG